MSKLALRGKHLIAGAWHTGQSIFHSTPFSGPKREFFEGDADLISIAATSAEEAFEIYGWSSRKDRAIFLRRIADEIEAIGHWLRKLELRKQACLKQGLKENAGAPQVN